jgi:hypothetical protein
MLIIERAFWLLLVFIALGLTVSAICRGLLPETEARLVTAGIDNLIFFSSFMVLLIAVYLRGYEVAKKEEKEAKSH